MFEIELVVSFLPALRKRILLMKKKKKVEVNLVVAVNQALMTKKKNQKINQWWM